MTVGTDKALVAMTEPASRNVAGLTSAGLGLVCNTFEDVWRMSQIIAKSGFVPKGITTPEQVSVQIMMGMEVGLRPMVAVQNIAVINNKAAIPGDLALAILLSSGLLEEHEEGVEGEGDKRVGFCRVKRKGMKGLIERKFSVDDAIKAGLWETKPTVRKSYYDKTTKQRVTSNYDTPNDSPWWKYQDRMLVMRARGFAFRDRFSDVLKGMHLSEEFTGHDFEEAEFTPASTPQMTGPVDAPDEDAIDEAVVLQAQASAPRREAAIPLADGRTIPVEAMTGSDAIHGSADIPQAGSEVSGGPTDDVETFDAEAWILERRVDFNQAADLTVVDQIHEMFGDTAETMLSLTQREVYAAAHQEAMDRFSKPTASENTKPSPGPTTPLTGPDGPDEDDAGFPGDSAIQALQSAQGADEPSDGFSDVGRAFDQKIRMFLQDPARTLDSLQAGFNSNTAEIAALVADGDLPPDYDANLRSDFGAEYKRIKNAAKEASGGTGDAKADAMTELLRSKLAAAGNVDEVNAASTSTLPERNTFGSKHPLYEPWRQMIVARRKELSALAE